jgi:FKBP-type peptidyl-prolyl cis-trans isomerase
MKNFIIYISFFLAVVSVQAKAIQEEINIAEEKARMSYAFGMTVGSDLRQAGLELDYSAFTEGLKTAMEQGQLLIGRDEALEIIQTAFENAMTRQAEQLRMMELIFLAENAMREGIITTPSGLQYMVIEEGPGPKPVAGDIVQVHYEGSLTDGTVVDSSFGMEHGELIPLDMVIPGWVEGILLMNVGSMYRIFIPSDLAYGEYGAGQIIPPYSTLIFTIELIDIVKIEES